MSLLTISHEHDPSHYETISDFETMQRTLAALGVLFERWQADTEIAVDATQAQILDAYKHSIAFLNQQYGFKSVDVIHLTPDHPERTALRQKFLSEHSHDDFEIRFFVRGCAIFYLHIENLVYMVQCNQGDLISVPAQTQHWFDMGEHPDFSCIRMFTTEQGWQAKLTGSDIATQFPTYEQLVKLVQH